MPDTRHFYTQPLQLVTASVNNYHTIKYFCTAQTNKDNCLLNVPQSETNNITVINNFCVLYIA